MARDASKRIGRFFKKGDPLLATMSLKEYSFVEILKKPFIEHDNYSFNIIHARLHDKEELASAVKKPPRFDTIVQDHAKPHGPILNPSDFTEDWHKERIKIKRRSRGHDDDDDDFDGTEIATDESTLIERELLLMTELEDVLKEKPVNTAPTETVSSPPNPPNVTVDPEAPAESSVQVQMVAPQAMPAVNPEELMADLASEFVKPSPEQQMLEQAEVLPPPEPAPVEPPVAAVPVPEMPPPSPSSQETQEGHKLLEKLGQALQEIDQAKQQMMKSAQSNFTEILHALAESLLQREFTINPAALSSLIQSAIRNAVEGDKYVVKVHPLTFEKLQALSLPYLKEHLAQDDSLAPSDFRIEAPEASLNLNPKSLVNQVLEQIDKNLEVEEPIKKVG